MLSNQAVTMKKRLLIVDNEPGLTFFLAENLSELGPDYEIETCHNGKEAVALTGAGEFNLVITDYRMPEMNGLQLIRFFNQHHPNTQLILMTAYGSEIPALQTQYLNIAQYITKPFAMEDMLAAVQAAIETQSKALPPVQTRPLVKELQRVNLHKLVDATIARATVRQLADSLGYSLTDQVSIATAIFEIAQELVTYAGQGSLIIRWREDDAHHKGLEILGHDQGLNKRELTSVLLAGGEGAYEKMNLMGLKKLVDEFEITQDAQLGNCVRLLKWRV